MIKKYLVLIVILAVGIVLPAQNIDLKMRRLEYIQGQIDQKREQIEKTKSEINELSRDKENYEQQYQSLQNKIDKLTAEEQEINRTLRDSQRKMELSKTRLDETSALWQKQLYLFYMTHQVNNKSHESVIDKQYFPLMICQTKEIIDENQELLSLIKRNVEQTQSTQQRIRTEKNRENQVIGGFRNEISKLDNQIVSLVKEEEDISREFQELLRNRQSLENLITHFQTDPEGAQFSYQFTTSKLLWPLKGEVITNFGEVHDKHHNVTLLNNGIDIVVDRPQEVKAVDFGVVVFAELFMNYGRLIIIDHHNGYFSLYSNNGNLLVAKDDVVSLGQPIAIAGKKNNSDNYMLHFELRKNRTPVDPLAYLE